MAWSIDPGKLLSLDHSLDLQEWCAYGEKNEKNEKTTIEIIHVPGPSKRHQLKKAFEELAKQKEEQRPKIIVLFDDHVIWPPHYLKWALAPFEEIDENRENGNKKKGEVVAVAMNKRALRDRVGSKITGDGWHDFSWASFWKFLGAVYLERHNFELKATNYIDGSVFVISSRTALYKTNFLVDPDLCEALVHEYVWFGKFGPLNADDDNSFTGRIVLEGGKKSKEKTKSEIGRSNSRLMKRHVS